MKGDRLTVLLVLGCVALVAAAAVYQVHHPDTDAPTTSAPTTTTPTTTTPAPTIAVGEPTTGQMWAGGTPNFDETTGQYLAGTVAGSGSSSFDLSSVPGLSLAGMIAEAPQNSFQPVQVEV